MTKIFTGNFAYFKNLHAYASSHYEQDAKILHAIIKLLPKNLYQLYLAERTNDQKEALRIKASSVNTRDLEAQSD